MGHSVATNEVIHMNQTQKTITERIADEREAVSDLFDKAQREVDYADELIEMSDEIRTLKARISTLENTCEFNDCEISELNAAVSLLTAELESLPRLQDEIYNLETKRNEDFELIMKAIRDATTR